MLEYRDVIRGVPIVAMWYGCCVSNSSFRGLGPPDQLARPGRQNARVGGRGWSRLAGSWQRQVRQDQVFKKIQGPARRVQRLPLVAVVAKLPHFPMLA
jgi:hypothetical protein